MVFFFFKVKKRRNCFNNNSTQNSRLSCFFVKNKIRITKKKSTAPSPGAILSKFNLYAEKIPTESPSCDSRLTYAHHELCCKICSHLWIERGGGGGVQYYSVRAYQRRIALFEMKLHLFLTLPVENKSSRDDQRCCDTDRRTKERTNRKQKQKRTVRTVRIGRPADKTQYFLFIEASRNALQQHYSFIVVLQVLYLEYERNTLYRNRHSRPTHYVRTKSGYVRRVHMYCPSHVIFFVLLVAAFHYPHFLFYSF